jgi:hypothetical protein
MSKTLLGSLAARGIGSRGPHDPGIVLLYPAT